MAQLVIGVEATGEHCTSLTEKNSVVDPQCKGKAGRRKGHCCRHQLHRLAAMAESPTSAVTTGEGCPGTGDEACVELAKAHRGEKSARLAEVVENVRSVSRCVGSKPKVVVRVGSPQIGLKWSSGVEGDMQGPIPDEVVQDSEAIVVHEGRVSALAEENDKSTQLAVEGCTMERGVATLRVLPIQWGLLLP